ncbi:hypothetical protein [Devosia sp.]|uniref:hypothetical protein n=1 Tax=Devosia sp. TaxID=1871048 RepID=UPI001AC5B553|nr:hypothetical protein [Devosia sp.]MBN9334029.1 hypothetical protein [Devosia sp.]
MIKFSGAWDGRRRAITLGMISNVVGATAAAGAAIAAWLTTVGEADHTQWALILAGIGGVFVAKGTVILAIAESRPFVPAEGIPELTQSILALDGRISARHKAAMERLDQLEAEVAYLRSRNHPMAATRPS